MTDDEPVYEIRIDRHRCPSCGAFCKSMWIEGGWGTDPKWQCKNCGDRT